MSEYRAAYGDEEMRLRAERTERAEESERRWLACGERLWPYVRYFGLFGGDVEAIEAAAELAKLLGKASGGQSGDSSMLDVNAVIESTRRATADAISKWFEGSKYIRRMVPEMRDECVEAIRKLAE